MQFLMRSVFRWIGAFDVLKARLASPSKAAQLLELHMRCVHVSAATATCEDATVFDSLIPVYQDLVDLSESILKGSNTFVNFAPRFCLDTGVVMPLWSVAHKCRDKSIRQRAISLLLSFPRREGLWDSTLAGKITECVMNFEEDYRESGVIPEWARIYQLKFETDLEQRTVWLECRQRSSGSIAPVTRRKTITW